MRHFSVLLALAFAMPAFAATPSAPNPHAGMKMPATSAPDARLTQTATVLSFINVPSYTYIEASRDKKTIWLAAATIAVKKGDVIRFDDGMVMNNFYSSSLKRNFPSILFVNQAVVAAK